MAGVSLSLSLLLPAASAPDSDPRFQPSTPPPAAMFPPVLDEFSRMRSAPYCEAVHKVPVTARIGGFYSPVA